MRSCAAAALILAAGSSLALARPATQIPFSAPQSSANDEPFNFRTHMSGISPYHAAGGQANQPPEGCSVSSAVYLVRHSAITANDDEFDDYMKPVIKKLHKYKWKKSKRSSKLHFLKDWNSPITDDNLEKLTDPGSVDSYKMGKRFRELYPNLLPDEKEPFEIWAADASRDVGTAKAFIKGIVPDHDEGKGTGDGHVKLVKVPLSNRTGWQESLTPHKVCDAFSKKNGKPEKEQFEAIYTKPIIKRFSQELPKFKFTFKDIVGLQMLCGYESVIRGNSPICNLFEKDDWLGFEYAQDLHYNKMLGYDSKIGPYLGYPWLHTATYHLFHVTEKNATIEAIPPPEHAPNSTHYQNLFFYFTHREEPPTVLTTLGLFKDDTPSLPADHIVSERNWKTSNILPFLGHVALERLQCESGDSVRVLVNEATVPLPTCQTGPGQSCPIHEFRQFMEERKQTYGDFYKGCEKS